MLDVSYPIELNPFVMALMQYARETITTVTERNVEWRNAWDEMRDEGLEDHIHIKAHRLCNCPEDKKRECLIDLLAYAAKRFERF